VTTVAQRAPQRPTARIEEAIGFVGTFGVLFLGVTVFCEVTGRPALGWALTLLVCVLAVVVLDLWRVAVLRRAGSPDGVGGAPAAPAPSVRPTAVRSAPTRPAAPGTRGTRGTGDGPPVRRPSGLRRSALLPGGTGGTGGATDG